MANILNNSSIYDLNAFIEGIKSKYVKKDDMTLSMGIYGYLSDINSTMLQNSIIMASEFSNEAIATKAKYNKNIITHALNLGIKDINAIPAEMDVCIVIPEADLKLNIFDNKFIWDREMPIFMGKYEMHPEYDIIITKVDLAKGDYVYTAQYDITNNNPINNSYIVNPYLPPVARVNNNNEDVIVITCKLRQFEFKHINRSIVNNNPILNKVAYFSFNNQLAGFDVDISNYDKSTIHLDPLYEGTFNSSTKFLNFCNYTYIDEKRIRLIFNDTSALPNMNTEIVINLWTTFGSEGNFDYKDTIYFNLFSQRINYDRVTAMIIPISSAKFGINSKSMDDLKRIIPKEALARNSVTNTTDINNFFNSIDYSTNKNMMYFFKKMDNPLYRTYYAYMVLTNGYNIIPTNSIPINCERKEFDSISGENFVLNAGNAILYDSYEGKILVKPSKKDLDLYNKVKFLYLNPFLCIINKSPLFVSYFINFMDTNKFIKFEYINKYSLIQFINSGVHWYKHFFTDPNTYNLEFSLIQNITSDVGIVHFDNPLDPTEVTSVDLKIILVFYKNKKPYRWVECKLVKYESESFTFHYKVQLHTDNRIDNNNCIKIKDLNVINSKDNMYGFMSAKTDSKLFIFVKDNERESAGIDKANNIIPKEFIKGYSLSNIYEINDGLNFLYNYSNIIHSNIKISKNNNSGLTYAIDNVPMIGYFYCNTEQKIQEFLLDIQQKSIKIKECLDVLEDNFSIDLKFFNTYGPSKLFTIDENTYLNKVNLSITFNIKFNITTEINTLLQEIKEDIRSYIEDITQIKDLHIPNLITFITEKYKNYLVYFEFVDFNGYGPSKQHIYRKDESLIGKIPEFLNINTINTKDHELDIKLIVK